MDSAQQSIERKKLKAVIENITEGVIITNSSRDIVQVNRAAMELTGFGETEMIDQFVGDFIKIFEEEKEIQVDEYCPTYDIELESEGALLNRKGLRLIDKSNETKVVNFTSKKIKEGKEADLGCIIVITDTSRELEIERMKLDFISMTAHVLRTPVTILRGYSNILMNEKTITKLDETEIEAINEIATASNNLAGQIENLLKVAEIREGNIDVHLIPVNVEGLINSVIEEYHKKAEFKGIQLNYIPSPEKLPAAMADVVKTKEVLEKLMDNAIKFTDNGHVNVGAVLEGNFIVIAVQDTGKGIPKENQDKIFQKFYRVKTNLNMEDGRGMGLYIAKKLMEAMHGTIGAQSELGKGSTFYFKLPLAEHRAP